MQTPTDVGGNKITKRPGFREQFKTHYEADIPFIRNFIRCIGITGGFSLDNPQSTIHYTQIKPIDFTLSPYIAILDIEVYSKARFPREPSYPIITATLWDNKHKQYVTIILAQELSTPQEIIKQEKVFEISKKEICEKLKIKSPLKDVSWSTSYNLNEKGDNIEVLVIKVKEHIKQDAEVRYRVFGQ